MATPVVGDDHVHLCSNNLCHKSNLCTSPRLHEGHITSDYHGQFRVVQFCSANCEREVLSYSMSDDEEPDDSEDGDEQNWPPLYSPHAIYRDENSPEYKAACSAAFKHPPAEGKERREER